MGCGVMMCTPLVSAATSTSTGGGQALEIAPPIITLTANPGQTIKTQIKLRDVAGTNLLVTNQVDDFVAAGEDGTPKILTGSDDNSNPFSLKNWITPLQSLTLKPKEIETLAVTIHVPTDASPGGHYGVIRFTGTAPQLNGTGVSLSASLGALVLLTVNGQLHDNLTLQEFSVNNGGSAASLFESTPLTFVVRLKNNGNVQEEPTGHIVITDMFGKAIAGVNVNLPPRNILPSSIRKFTSPLDQTVIGDTHLFGRYQAAIELTYGNTSKKTLTANLTFWVIPYRLIALVVVILIAAFFILRFTIRRYNRLIISRARYGRYR